jgi:hypothetical protein
MALTPSFSLSQTSNPLDPTSLVITDTSTGSDGSIASVQVQLKDVNNNPFASSPYNLAYVLNGTYTINPFVKDAAITVVVNWLNGSGTILYTSNQLFVNTSFGELFLYQLTQQQTASPNIVNDSTFYTNKEKLREELDSAQKAISVANDITGAQNCLNRAYLLENNQNYFF